MTDLQTWLPKGVAAISAWQDTFGAFEQHPSLVVSDDALGAALDRLQAAAPRTRPRDQHSIPGTSRFSSSLDLLDFVNDL